MDRTNSHSSLPDSYLWIPYRPHIWAMELNIHVTRTRYTHTTYIHRTGARCHWFLVYIDVWPRWTSGMIVILWSLGTIGYVAGVDIVATKHHHGIGLGVNADRYEQAPMRRSSPFDHIGGYDCLNGSGKHATGIVIIIATIMTTIINTQIYITKLVPLTSTCKLGCQCTSA